MAPYHIDIMNEDIAKFVYDSMQQRTKRKTKIMRSTSLRAFFIFFYLQNFVAFDRQIPTELHSIMGCPKVKSIIRHRQTWLIVHF